MDAMNINNITALADMLKQEDVDGSQSASSHVTPASLGVAAPASNVAAVEAPKKQTAAKSKSAEQNEEGDIWDVEEVPDKIDIAFEKDSRKRPTYDILYKQSVSAMDAFGGGLTGNTPSSISCNQIVVKIKFPGHKMKDLDLDVTREKLVAQSATHRLAIALPYPVKDQEGSAKWTQDDCTLSVTLPIIREMDF
eukprot:INCI3415.1.p2 GENE.INCI3415.1~~INCI3415.1.p2  ORF type:complete len:194 (-),score=41.67 INCI3415.1:67-648(-)